MRESYRDSDRHDNRDSYRDRDYRDRGYRDRDNYRGRDEGRGRDDYRDSHRSRDDYKDRGRQTSRYRGTYRNGYYREKCEFGLSGMELLTTLNGGF